MAEARIHGVGRAGTIRLTAIAPFIGAAACFPAAAAREAAGGGGAGAAGGRCPEADPFTGGGVVSLCAGHFPEASEYADWVVHFYGRECRHCRETAHIVR